MKFLLLCLDKYLFIVVSSNRYLSRGSKENALSTSITGNVTIGSTGSNCTIFGFCYDSLNSLNSYSYSSGINVIALCISGYAFKSSSLYRIWYDPGFIIDDDDYDEDSAASQMATTVLILISSIFAFVIMY